MTFAGLGMAVGRTISAGLCTVALAVVGVEQAQAQAQAAAPSPEAPTPQEPAKPPPPPVVDVAALTAKAEAGEASAQMALGDAYFSGAAGKRDHAQARKWYEKAARQGETNAARKLGEMYARGDGGRKDGKKAMKYWSDADKAGDPLAAILVADHLFSEMTGGRTPGPGTYAFKGGIPVADVEVVESWYRQALERDPRQDVRDRATKALSTLESFKAAAKSPGGKP
jgi:TPR repeat protein